MQNEALRFIDRKKNLFTGIINNIQPMVEYYSFEGTQYVFFSQRVTWDEANMLCITFDAKLAILDTKSKATNVAQSMAESDIGNIYNVLVYLIKLSQYRQMI